MAHPKETKRASGKLWHLEDEHLSSVAARSLKVHLKNTEEKLARTNKTKEGYEVWWAKK